jgi:hypothetical protein
MSRFDPRDKSLWLQRLCEANYRRLCHLVPGLRTLDRPLRAEAEGQPALHVRPLEWGPFTRHLELTHAFGDEFETLSEPAIRLRICFDAETVEMLGDHAPPWPVAASVRRRRGRSSTTSGGSTTFWHAGWSIVSASVTASRSSMLMLIEQRMTRPLPTDPCPPTPS